MLMALTQAICARDHTSLAAAVLIGMLSPPISHLTLPRRNAKNFKQENMKE